MYYKIAELRKDNKLTHKQVGKLLLISQQAYSRCETGKREFSLEMLVRLAKFYGVSVDYLVGLSDDPTPYPPAKNNR